MIGSAFLMGFGLATFKFVLAAYLTFITFHDSELMWLEVFISTSLGALLSFNIFYKSANYFMARSKRKKMERLAKGDFRSRNFSKINKLIVKLKRSKMGFWTLSVLGPVFLSVPLGALIVAKFYGNRKITYWLASFNLIIWAFGLAIAASKIV